MRTQLLLGLVAVAFSGCMTTHELWGESPATVSAGLTRCQGKEVDLTLTNGSYYQDVTFSFFGDSVAIRSDETRLTRVVPLTSVASVSKSGSVLVPIAGCVGGLLVGGAIGAGLAVEDHTSGSRKGTAEAFGAALTAPLAAAAGGAVGALVGGIGGLVIGSFLGSGDRYVLDPGPDSGIPNERGERCLAIGVTAAGDSVFMGLAALVERTPAKLTVLWHGTRLSLQSPPAQVVKRGRNLQIIAPEKTWQ